MFCSLDCILLSGGIDILGDPKEIEILANSWESWLFHCYPDYVGESEAIKMQSYLKQSRRVDHITAVLNADFVEASRLKMI